MLSFIIWYSAAYTKGKGRGGNCSNDELQLVQRTNFMVAKFVGLLVSFGEAYKKLMYLTFVSQK